MNNADMPAMPMSNEKARDSFCRQNMATPDGLTKREYFAGLAMQGLLSGIPSDELIGYSEVAGDSIHCADALLAELERTK